VYINFIYVCPFAQVNTIVLVRAAVRLKFLIAINLAIKKNNLS